MQALADTRRHASEESALSDGSNPFFRRETLLQEAPEGESFAGVRFSDFVRNLPRFVFVQQM